MAQHSVEIGGRQYELKVRDGQEAHFSRLAAIIDEKAQAVGGAMAGVNESRQLLMAALLLADELSECRAEAATAPQPSPAPTPAYRIDTDVLAEEIEALAARIERAASALEKSGEAP